MAESKAVQRARSLTNFDTDIITESTASTLEETAKDEIRVDLEEDNIDFSTPNGRSALMWIICLFFKIHIGEIGADGYHIGEVESKDLEGQADIWLQNYNNAKHKLAGSNIFGSTTTRRSGREYGDDGDTSFGDS